MTKDDGFPAIINSALYINGKTQPIAGYRLVGELGRGANAVVFEAEDVALSRAVAIKVWNGRGRRRAQFEAAKIAKMNHQAIVQTYRFDTVAKHPYCVMEIVRGVSGKEWIKQNHSVRARIELWRTYSSALHYIHSLGHVHGDPHLGNILIAASSPSPSNNGFKAAEPPIVAKVADCGTSECWRLHEDFEERERLIILETIARVFAEEGFSELWQQPSGLDYRRTLTALEAYIRYLEIVCAVPDWDMRGLVADALARLIVENPFFNLEAVVSRIGQQDGGVTTKDRLVRRINARLRGIHDPMEASSDLDGTTMSLYLKAANQRAAAARAQP